VRPDCGINVNLVRRALRITRDAEHPRLCRRT
jgi:hypothetical protein